MSITGITPNSGSYDPSSIQSNYQKQRADFATLAQALQSGNLSAAQSAFGQLQSDAPNATGSSTSSTSNSGKTSPIQQDLAAIGQALQSGDVSGAQTAFAKLQQDAKSLGASGHHHHHHHAQGTEAQGADSQSAASQILASSTSGNTINVTA